MSLSTRILCFLVIAALLFFGGYFLGKADERTNQQAKKAVALESVIVTHNEVAAGGQAVERETVRRTVKTEAVFNGIQQGVTTYAQNHPAADDCRLDAGGLRLWRAANANADPLPAGERDAALPDAADAAERRDDRSADQPYRGDQGLSPVQGPAPGAGGLAGENAR